MPFAREVYVGRRAMLAQTMKNGIAIIRTSPEVIRSNDIYYPFRPESSFYYLTGFAEPEAVLAVIAGEKPRSILFCRSRDINQEIWNGYRCGYERAPDILGVDEAYGIGAFDEVISKEIKNIPLAHADVEHMLFEMRLIKTREEIDCMRTAAQISIAAHLRAMYACRPNLMEYELESELVCEFRKRGGSLLSAYPPVVAGGEHACTLHYIANNAPLRDGDLVLIDAGCELDCYAADVTRTFPVNGRFTSEQKALYKIVLAAQTAAIECVCPGKTFIDPHNAAIRTLTEGLVEVGILQGNVNELIAQKAYTPFFIHGTSHWLGLDVHDVGDIKVDNEYRTLEPGMVLTVEPGLYIESSNERINPRWRGIGIRIEDDILVTNNGYEVLSSGMPKTVYEIESFMKN